MRVVITVAAKADLIAIRRFIEPLLDRCQALAETPGAYSLVPRYERFGIPRCVHGDYRPAGRTVETPCRKSTDTGL